MTAGIVRAESSVEQSQANYDKNERHGYTETREGERCLRVGMQCELNWQSAFHKHMIELIGARDKDANLANSKLNAKQAKVLNA